MTANHITTSLLQEMTEKGLGKQIQPPTALLSLTTLTTTIP
jgi:hypothetical protein